MAKADFMARGVHRLYLKRDRSLEEDADQIVTPIKGRFCAQM